MQHVTLGALAGAMRRAVALVSRLTALDGTTAPEPARGWSEDPLEAARCARHVSAVSDRSLLCQREKTARWAGDVTAPLPEIVARSADLTDP